MVLSRRGFLKGVAIGTLGAAGLASWADDEPATATSPEAKATLLTGPLGRRGIHVEAGGASNVAALERLVGEIAPALGMNWVIAEIGGGFQYAIVFDLLDELIDAFEAKAFHVGMDEVFILGNCPRCKGTSNGELFAKAVNDLHGHLVGTRKVEMQMWGDRLLHAETMGYGEWESSANGTWQAIDMVPKDIVLCDWHYGMDNPSFPSIRFFQDKGFRVWPAGWNEEESIRKFIEVARKEAGPLMLGYLCTSWSNVTAVVNGLAGEPTEGGRRGVQRIVAGVKLGAELSRG
jgi:hypothetical protein